MARPEPGRVLLVDDDPSVVSLITMAFARAGREAVGCSSFQEGRSRLLAEDFRCLIADVRLGEFNGLQLAVIARERRPGMGIIIFTGFDDPVLREEAAHLNARYLVKPVTSEQLLALVDAC